MGVSNIKKQFLKNVGSGWLAVGLTGVVGLVLLPINLKYLGKELYGISILAISLLNILSFLSFGMGPILLRFFAQAIVEKEEDDFKNISSTAQTILGGMGLFGAFALLTAFPFFVENYSISLSCRPSLFVLFLAMAFSCFENLYTLPFLGIIQASHRYDIGNVIRILSVTIRLVTLYGGYLIFPASLSVMAGAIFLEAAFKLTALLFFAWKIGGSNVFWRWRNVRWNLVPSLFSFSALNFVNSLFFSLSLQIPLLIIGRFLGKEMVAAYAPAGMISGAVSLFLCQICSPLTPLATEDALKNDGKKLGRWSLLFGETVACAAGGCLIIFVLFGSEIITLWLGVDFAWIQSIVVVTVLGTCLAAIQAVNNNLALGANTIAPFAYSSIVMMLTMTVGAWVGLDHYGWGLFGVAIYIAAVRLARNGFYIAFVYSRIFHYRYLLYFYRVYLKPTAVCFLFCVFALWLKKQLGESFDTVFGLVGGCVVAEIVYGVLAVFLLFDRNWRKKIGDFIGKRLRRG